MNISIDRGGTFTDVYAQSDGKIYVQKLLSVDPNNYQDAPTEGIKRLLKQIKNVNLDTLDNSSQYLKWIRMGTTVATNALLEHQGTPTALLITKGFGDLLDIGYQNRPKLFELNIQKAKMLYQEVIEIDERVLVDGESFKIETSLNQQNVKKELVRLYKNGIKSIAVVLMHAYGFAEHELQIESLAKSIGFTNISLSHRVMPAVKIVDRGHTTVIDAYLTPHIQEYISHFKSGFEDKLVNTPLSFMQSFGGLSDAKSFRGSNAILSGPAGGVVGLASMYDGVPLIGFDMGGTSTDVSRYGGEYERSFEHEINGVTIRTPQMDILTVAAGGGSRLFYKNGMFVVGPQSSGANPGPVCYRKNGYLSITDANLVLGRIQVEYFPKIFGKSEKEPLDYNASYEAFKTLAKEINATRETPLSVEEIALGFIEVANDTMIKPIKEISTARGFNIAEHHLVPFGGAGSQHACAIAKMLGIKNIHIHRYAGILSAFGLSQADTIEVLQTSINKELGSFDAQEEFARLIPTTNATIKKYFLLRYSKSEHSFLIPYQEDILQGFQTEHKKLFGFILNDSVIVDEIKVELITSEEKVHREKINTHTTHTILEHKDIFFENSYYKTPIYEINNIQINRPIQGPALIMDKTSTIIIEPKCEAILSEYGDIRIKINAQSSLKPSIQRDAIWLSLFSNLFSSLAEQMGNVLQKTAISTNIKERLDFSCALFDAKGELIANAPHVPVHLGSMSVTVKSMLSQFKNSLKKGDAYISNTPYQGGSHLPDITVMSPFIDNDGNLIGVVANRGHHADIGGITPGSMPPFSTRLEEEGAIIETMLCLRNGALQEERLTEIFTQAGARKIDENIADINAQIAANVKGLQLLDEAIAKYSQDVISAYMAHIQDVSATAIQKELLSYAKTKKSELYAEDYLDDGSKIALKLSIDIQSGEALFDFSSSSDQLLSNQNAPISVVTSAVIYALRALINEELPLNGGLLKPITIKLRNASMLSPDKEAAVVGGNVTTSQRVVDVIFKAFKNVAASSGCMNNVTFGNKEFGYYETIAGGAGAGDGFDGASGVHTHMTNTRITDPEVLERRYPVILHQFAYRKNSGGSGKYRGGNGLVREIEFLTPMQISILSERRVIAPWGVHGGGDALRGENWLVSHGKHHKLKGKVSLTLKANERLLVKTPGGGGYEKAINYET